MTHTQFSIKALEIDCQKETEKIVSCIRTSLSATLKRRGLVLGISGGIDSSVCLALAVRAVGPQRVIALQMPEKHSQDETVPLSSTLAQRYGVTPLMEDITPLLNAAGCYKRYNEAVAHIIPEYTQEWKSKISISDATQNRGFSVFTLIARSPQGITHKKTMDLQTYLSVVAATNFKQRCRKMLEYHYADSHHYAVIGTANRLEYDLGFFVKLGDGAADLKLIAHLYKSQVYQLAAYLKVPQEIIKRPPTTDTYSLPQSQDEFYFTVSYEHLDLCLYGKNNNIPIESVAQATGLSLAQVQSIYADIDRKRLTTLYLHHEPILVEKPS